MKIEHIAMYVTDLEAAKTFFVTYFDAKANGGYHNPKTGFRSYFLSFDEGARLELMHRPQLADDVRQINRTGYIHIAFSLGSRENVERLTDRMRSDGFAVLSGPRTTGDGYYESCIVDLEGNQIELTV